MIINTEAKRQAVIEMVNKLNLDDCLSITFIKKPKQRTHNQNKCLHEYLRTLATALNEAGFEQRATLRHFKDGVDIPWTDSSLKDLFRAVAMALYDIKSTSDLTTIQIQDVYLAFDSRISEISGVHIEWPSVENKL